MARKTITYRKLPGKARRNLGLFDSGRYRLWLASDHLLHVKMRYFSESYRRFYLNDIQALVLSRTTKGRTANIVLAILAGFFASCAALAVYALKWPVEVGITLAVIGGTLLLITAYNAALGPTCACRLYTAVQVEDLFSLGRLRTARRTIARLRPLIEAAQGRLTPEELSAHSEDGFEMRASVHADVKVPDQSTPIQKHEDGRTHSVVFFLMLILAATALADIYYQHPVKNLLDLGLYVASLVFLALALRKQHYSDLPAGLKGITWSVLGVSAGSFVFGLIFTTAYWIIHAPQAVGKSPAQLRIEGPVFIAYCGIVAFLYSILAVIGLTLLRQWRTTYARRQSNTSGTPTSEKGQ